MPFRATPRRLRSTILAIVLLAVALAQTLGVVHRIVHSPLTAHAAAAAGAHQAQAGAHFLQALFAGHSTEHGCDLYDQLSHSDLLQVETVVVALLLVPQACASVAPAGRIAARAAGFLARGPPLAG